MSNWQSMIWVMRRGGSSIDGQIERFRAPDGSEWDVQHTGLSLDQTKRIAYKKWREGRR